MQYHNRDIFRLGRYYAPYRDYRYRRLNIGVQIGNLFFGSRYWINDPWRYRLPNVYGPYRWVRYYDDVLLVDVYNGEVVDVKRPSSRQAKIDPLKAKAFHVVQQFLLLVDGWVERGRALQTVAKGFVVKPNLVRVATCVA